MVESVDDRVRRIVGWLLLRDVRAASELRQLAAQLIAAAESLEATEAGTREVGGTGDRVQMNLVGPDGTIKHHSDTGARP